MTRDEALKLLNPYAVDMGLLDVTTGKAMTRVFANPKAGQYVYDPDTKAYTFAAEDAGHEVVFPSIPSLRELLGDDPPSGDEE